MTGWRGGSTAYTTRGPSESPYWFLAIFHQCDRVAFCVLSPPPTPKHRPLSVSNSSRHTYTSLPTSISKFRPTCSSCKSKFFQYWHIDCTFAAILTKIRANRLITWPDEIEAPPRGGWSTLFEAKYKPWSTYITWNPGFLDYSLAAWVKLYECVFVYWGKTSIWVQSQRPLARRENVRPSIQHGRPHCMAQTFERTPDFWRFTLFQGGFQEIKGLPRVDRSPRRRTLRVERL